MQWWKRREGCGGVLQEVEVGLDGLDGQKIQPILTYPLVDGLDSSLGKHSSSLGGVSGECDTAIEGKSECDTAIEGKSWRANWREVYSSHQTYCRGNC